MLIASLASVARDLPLGDVVARGDVDFFSYRALSFTARAVLRRTMVSGFASRVLCVRERKKAECGRGVATSYSTLHFFFFSAGRATVGVEEHEANERESRAADAGIGIPGSRVARNRIDPLRSSPTLHVTGDCREPDHSRRAPGSFFFVLFLLLRVVFRVCP